MTKFQGNRVRKNEVIWVHHLFRSSHLKFVPAVGSSEQI